MHADAPTALAVSSPAHEMARIYPEQPPALALNDIVQRWRARTVLDGASLSIVRGTVAWLGGPNGTGKTTLLRIAAGVLVPTAGSVAMAGLDPERNRRVTHRRLGFLSAGDRGLYARLSVTHNLEFWAGIALVERRRKRDLIDAALERFELSTLARSRVDRISMGQRQRVRLAMTFLHEPELVLLDEPHTSMDERGHELLDGALDELTARGGAALWCSPAHVGVPLRADLRYRLQDGVVVAQ